MVQSPVLKTDDLKSWGISSQEQGWGSVLSNKFTEEEYTSGY